MEKRSIGWIGTGIMGAPMVRRLLEAGLSVVVHNRTRARAEPLLTRGAEWANSPAELAGRVEVVLSIVSDTPDVLSVYSADRADGVLATVRPGTLCIDMSTIKPEAAVQVGKALEAKACDFLDAPVSGGKTGAENGTLSIMAGGKAEDLQRAQPIFAHLAKRVVHCGPQGHGQEVKLCNQILCALNLLAVSEAVSYGRKAGLNLERMIEAVSAGAAGSWAVENLGGRMLKGDFAPMFMVDLQQKDLRIALDAAYGLCVPLPGTGLAHQLLTAAQAHREGREGTQVLLKTLMRLANEAAD